MRSRLPPLVVVVAVVCAVITNAGCATLPPPPAPRDPATLPSTALLAGVDWQKEGDAAFVALAGYLRVPSVNPPGNEQLAVDYLSGLLAEDGIDVEVWPLPVEQHGDNRANMVARVRASKPSGEGPLCLVSHTDVVTAEAERWPEGRGPQSGAIVEENGEQIVYGRGALDMKGMGLLEVQALRLLKRLGIPLRRDVIVLAVADEEVGSGGMIDVVEKHWDQLGCAHSLNEGGLGIKDALFPGQTAIGVSVGEKGFVWVRMTATGAPGHGSTPVPGRAPQRLLEAINKIAARKDRPRIHSSMYQLLAAAGREAGGVSGFVLERPSLVDALVTERLLAEPTTRALVTDTVNLTGLAGAEQPNVVPSQVFAQYDVRLLPGTSPAAAVDELKALVGDTEGISFEVIDEEDAAVSEWDDPLYRAVVQHAATGLPRTVVGPVLSPGFTDSIFLRQRGVRAYGFIPFIVSKQEASTMHGDAERVSLSNVRRGLEVLTRVVVDVAAAGP